MLVNQAFVYWGDVLVLRVLMLVVFLFQVGMVDPTRQRQYMCGTTIAPCE